MPPGRRSDGVLTFSVARALRTLERRRAYLPSQVPRLEVNVLVGYVLHVAPNGWLRHHNVAEMQLVQRRGLSRIIEACRAHAGREISCRGADAQVLVFSILFFNYLPIMMIL